MYIYLSIILHYKCEVLVLNLNLSFFCFCYINLPIDFSLEANIVLLLHFLDKLLVYICHAPSDPE